MSPVRKILEEIKWGISPEVLAKKHGWEELTPEDCQELLNFARYQPDSQQSYNLLVYLFRVSRDKDLWFSVDVLSQALQHPAMSGDDRNTILRTMRNRLDRVKEEITTNPAADEKLRKYWLLEASYYAIHGLTMAESNQPKEAIQDYQVAQGIFEQLGLIQQAGNFKNKIDQLRGSPVRPEKPAAASPPTARPSGDVPPSASFRGTMELIAEGKVPARPGEPAPPPPPPPATSQPVPEPPAAPELRQAEVEELSEVRLASVGQVAAQTSDSGIARTHPPETNLLDQNEVDELLSQADEPLQMLPTARPQARQHAGPPPAAVETPERRLFNELTAEASRLALQIQQQNEILSAIQLEIHMYMERRSLLFREVQSLEKKAASLKELCDRLEKKSTKLSE